ncbi:MAG TPA: GNAT family N-acetyltransferase, partial [Ktedonobacteraceae bacterium]|nr:GNAT family N-acetyltransferase [Ktedonobacteraceae bacterium]
MPLTSEPVPKHVGTLWLLDLGEPLLVAPVPRVEARFQRIGSESAPSLAEAMGLGNSEEVLKRFDAGKHCYIGNVDGVLAAYGWVTFDEELIGELGLYIRLLPGEAYIWNCVTLQDYRGLRLYPSLLWYIVEELRFQGLRRIWIGADADNIPSQVGMRLCGFRPIADFVLDYALALHSFWIRGHSDVPQQLVEDARRHFSETT